MVVMVVVVVVAHLETSQIDANAQFIFGVPFPTARATAAMTQNFSGVTVRVPFDLGC